jgi:hypothetical protein
MELKSEREVEVTREKLHLLEERYETIRNRPTANERVRELTLRSFRQTINQFKEDIIRFESRRRAETQREASFDARQ